MSGHPLVNIVVGTIGALIAAPLLLLAGITPPPADATPSPVALGDIPAGYLTLYQQAGSACPGLDWTVLAGVGKVESDHGRAPNLTSTAGAQGPMQFMPATWATYGVDGNNDGLRDPFNPADAIPAAAGYLCALGAGRDTPTALAAYNCGSSTSCQHADLAPGGYAPVVLGWATRYAQTVGLAPGPAAIRAVQAALSQVGTPYVWGGQAPGGFDCSGLTQWAYAQAGLALPRVAQQQHDATPALPPGAALAPGDLLFFGADSRHVTHEGLYLGDGRMVDAPHTGANVRVEPVGGFHPTYLGASRPTAPSSSTTSGAPINAGTTPSPGRHR